MLTKPPNNSAWHTLIQDALQQTQLSEDIAPTQEQWRTFLQTLANMQTEAWMQFEADARAEAQHAQKNRAFVEAILSNASDGIVVTDLEGRIEQSNLAFDEMFGLQPDECFNQHLSRYFSEDDTAVIQAGVTICAQGEERRMRIEATALRHDKTTFDADMMLATIMRQDRTRAGVVVSVRDISVAKMRERSLQEANEDVHKSLSRELNLWSALTHELRTPLNSIIGFSNVLIKLGDLTEEQTQDLMTIKYAGEHLLGLINDILDLSRLASGNIELRPHPLEMDKFLSSLLHKYSQQVQTKHLNLMVFGDDLQAIYVDVDELRLHQALSSLLNQAIHATSSGAIHFQTDIQHQTDEMVHIHWTITDTGKAMERAMREFVVAPFTPLSPDMYRSIRGDWLGLANAMSLLRLMGGTVQIKDNLTASGTAYHIDLRLPIVSP
jgi:PAS domain S-box-containing protein